MQNKRPPDYREKQRILYIDKKPIRDLIDYGDQYLKRGQIMDALEFYQRASHEQGLETIRNLSEEKGDVMIFQQAMKALNRKVSQEDWSRIGNTAFESGKLVFAHYAFANGGDEAMRDKIRSLLAEEKRG